MLFVSRDLVPLQPVSSDQVFCSLLSLEVLYISVYLLSLAPDDLAVMPRCMISFVYIIETCATTRAGQYECTGQRNPAVKWGKGLWVDGYGWRKLVLQTTTLTCKSFSIA
jgi:hypothetical protein